MSPASNARSVPRHGLVIAAQRTGHELLLLLVEQLLVMFDHDPVRVSVGVKPP